MAIVEIGPRFCLSLIKIFDASFSGAGIFESSTFVSPNHVRRMAKLESQTTYISRVVANAKMEAKMANSALEEDPLNSVFLEEGDVDEDEDEGGDEA